MSEHHHAPPPSDHHHHAEQASHQHHHHTDHASTGKRQTRGRRFGIGMSPLRTTSDPYPMIYSKDPFDARRYSPFGRGPSGLTSRGETIFAVVVIVAVLGIGLMVILVSLFGG